MAFLPPFRRLARAFRGARLAALLCRSATVSQHRRGDVLAKQGAAAEAFYVILSGQARGGAFYFLILFFFLTSARPFLPQAAFFAART